MTEAMFKEAVKNRTPIPIDVPLGDLKANMVVGGVAPLERGGCRLARWWFQRCVMFIPTWGDDPI